MKFVITFLLTALLSFAIGLFEIFPWWAFAICAFIVAIAVHQKPWKAFLAAFLALVIVWGGLAFYKDSKNEHLLSTKIAHVLPLGGSYIVLILVTALVGGLVAGFAAMTGSYLRRKKVYRYS